MKLNLHWYLFLEKGKQGMSVIFPRKFFGKKDQKQIKKITKIDKAAW